MLRDRIIIGGKDDPLKKVIETCKIYEAANANKILLERRNNASTVNAVSKTTDPECNSVSRYCYNCGAPFTQNHMRSCKAIDINCSNCGRKGHFSKFCKQKGKAKLNGQQQSYGNHQPRRDNNSSNSNNSKNSNNSNNSSNNYKKQTNSLNWNDED
ncbi:putative uncharacterized protein DDB_G0272516 [Episyrphus balteatus]|uniref:putative uncharacterized protein DDB_G0272516 n=1 Tax=Episyrphus balteatus TaxID=286459 RepID=UPI0024861C21|nr:putative uncharacterized protein DDB_G0272516 [Episyrphus balteatus]XP_055840009.1 putative uncharacterized protein DDB_G0272516 [Episyrphus balteatus]XP_055840010.1 putative uncharacterized protein DDB_G0272516 [Episyrphus balteatus]